MTRLTEEKQFEKWLSPEIVDFLIDRYAVTDPKFGRLGWEYSQTLGPRRWGEFSPSKLILRVSKAKTRDKFKQQVKTILHEIQHWNQYVKATENVIVDQNIFRLWRDILKDNDVQHMSLLNSRFNAWENLYQHAGGHRGQGYWNNHYEVDARKFAEDNVDSTMVRIGKMFYSEKIEGGSLDQVIEELFDEYIDSEKPLTRVQIGTTLRDYDLNNLENMKKVIEQLKSLEVKIVGVV